MVRIVPDEDKLRLYSGMTGKTLADAVFGDLIIHSQSRYLGDMMENVSSPSYQYYFSYLADERRATDPGVGHADEIAFVMQTLDADLNAVTDKDREVSKLISSYWVQFAQNGNPNGPGLPEWPAYRADAPFVLEIGDEVILHEDLEPDRLNYHKARGIANLEKVRDK
jgi:carboxylesterase type B